MNSKYLSNAFALAVCLLTPLAVSAQNCVTDVTKPGVSDFELRVRCSMPTPSPTPLPSATPSPTATPPVVTNPGEARIVLTSNYPGATLGDRLAAAKADLGATAGEIVIGVNGRQSIDRQIVFEEGTVVRTTGAGIVSSALAGSGKPYLVFKNKGSLKCASHAVVFQEPSAPGNFKAVGSFSAATNNADKTRGIVIYGCNFEGIGSREGDGAQGVVDLGNCVGCKFTNSRIAKATAIALQIGGTSAGLGAKPIDKIIAPAAGDHGSGIITTRVPHGAAVGDRVLIRDVSIPAAINSFKGSHDGVLTGKTLTSKAIKFGPSDVGNLVIMFKENPLVLLPTVITNVIDSGTVPLEKDAKVSTTDVQLEMPLTHGAAWVVRSVPSPTTLTVESAPITRESCNPCTGTLTVLNEAREVEITGNTFEDNSLVDIALVNAKRVLVSHNFLGRRRHCTSGAIVDVEPNVFSDLGSDISIIDNDFDARGGGCNVATALGGISLGSASGRPEYVLIAKNRFRGATPGPGQYGDFGLLTRDTFQMQQAVHIWQARDITIAENQVEGYYNFGIEAIGYGPTERLMIRDNSFYGDGNLLRLVNTRFSEVRGNRYESRDFLGRHNSQPQVSMTEEASSGMNLYSGNVGVSRYALGPGSFMKDGKGNSIASAPLIVPTGSFQHISGSIPISSISTTGIGLVQGGTITLIFDNPCRVQNGPGIKLVGGEEFRPGESLTLTLDDQRWVEVFRATAKEPLLQ